MLLTVLDTVIVTVCVLVGVAVTVTLAEGDVVTLDVTVADAVVVTVADDVTVVVTVTVELVVAVCDGVGVALGLDMQYTLPELDPTTRLSYGPIAPDDTTLDPTLYVHITLPSPPDTPHSVPSLLPTYNTPLESKDTDEANPAAVPAPLPTRHSLSPVWPWNAYTYPSNDPTYTVRPSEDTQGLDCTASSVVLDHTTVPSVLSAYRL